MTYIEYKPITNNIQTKVLDLNHEQILGFVLMASIVIDRINIKLQNGSTVDLSKIHEIQYFGYHPSIYHAKFGNYDVSFDSLDIIRGAIQLCLLFGFDPNSLITNVQQNGQPIQINPERYFGILEIPNPYNDTTVVSIQDLYLSTALVTSLTKSLNECFPGSDVGITLPSIIYMITSDNERSNVIASCMATLYFPESVNQYKIHDSYYIFNVCSNVQGQGLAKSIMICMLNDLINKGYKNFMLEVAPTNIIAYNLYQSLGFKKLISTSDNSEIYDLMALQIANQNIKSNII